MSHVALIPLTGLRVRDEAMLELGMTLPGLRQRAGAIRELPSLGLLTLAGMTPREWTCSYHEASQCNGELVESIAADRPTFVAVSALTASIEDAYALCDALRARRLPVVLGGLHATCCPDEARRHCDSVIIGEGESVWREVLHDAAEGCQRPTYRGSRPFDLADAPIPRFDLLGGGARQRMTLQTERGCPFACDFCGASRLLGSFREKPVRQIAKELDAITAVAPKPWLELADDNTFAGQRDADELLDVLASAEARYFTEADWRIGEDPAVLRGLAASGCVQVLIGIESLVFRYPGMGAKQAELERIMAAARAIQEAGVVVNACFIVGADGETHESLDRLVEFINESPLAEVQITLQTPFPGTALYERLRREGRLIAERGWSHYTLFDVTFRPDCMTVAELEDGFRRVVRAVFSRDASRRRDALRKQIWRSHPRFRT